jgi:hypothetical protein
VRIPRAGTSTTTGATTPTRARPRSIGCWPRDALTFVGPLACGGRVLSADHAPQTPQAPSEDVSAATRPTTVFARVGTCARVAVRERYSFAAAAPAPDRRAAALRRSVVATVVCLRVGEPTVRSSPPRGEQGQSRLDGRVRGCCSRESSSGGTPAAAPPCRADRPIQVVVYRAYAFRRGWPSRPSSSTAPDVATLQALQRCPHGDPASLAPLPLHHRRSRSGLHSGRGEAAPRRTRSDE